MEEFNVIIAVKSGCYHPKHKAEVCLCLWDKMFVTDSYNQRLLYFNTVLPSLWLEDRKTYAYYDELFSEMPMKDKAKILEVSGMLINKVSEAWRMKEGKENV